MVTALQVTPFQIAVDRDRYRVARDLCRRRSPDLFFASHFTSKSRRYGIYVLDALGHQFEEIMGPPQVGGSLPATVSQAGSCCSGGGCDGESIAQRQQVCMAVIDHLLSGQETGKPELDAFADVQVAAAWPREWFERWITAMATLRTLPRYATWKRLGETLANSTGMQSLMMARLLGAQTGVDAMAMSSVNESQILAWGGAMRFCTALEEVGKDVHHRRLLIPLDDLIKHQLTERDIHTFAKQQSTHNDPRWQALMQFELDRVRNLLRGGAKAMSMLADEGSRRTFAATGVFALRKLERLMKAGGDPFATQITMNTWHRITSMPRAVRIVWGK